MPGVPGLNARAEGNQCGTSAQTGRHAPTIAAKHGHAKPDVRTQHTHDGGARAGNVGSPADRRGGGIDGRPGCCALAASDRHHRRVRRRRRRRPPARWPSGCSSVRLLIARWTIPGAEAPPPRCGGDYGGSTRDATPLRLAVLGDSTAAGYGVHTRGGDPGRAAGHLASPRRHARPVRLTCPAVVGSVSAWLPAAGRDRARGRRRPRHHLHRRQRRDDPGGRVARGRHLAEAVRRLAGAGAEVVVATCPDLGTIRPIQPPLRWLARRWSRQLAAAQTVAVVRGGRPRRSRSATCSVRASTPPRTGCSATTGTTRRSRATGAAADVVLPTALAALGLTTRRMTAPRTQRFGGCTTAWDCPYPPWTEAS